MASSSKSPVGIFTALTRDRGTAKEAAIRAIDSTTTDADRATLRTLLLQALIREYVAPAPGQFDDLRASDARCWILSALGRVADRDDDCNREVRRHLETTVEPYEWARYWALEGLVAGKAPDLEELARHIVVKGEDPLVLSLAYAILASRGDAECLRAVQDRLTNNSRDTWAMLRALRVVPVLNPAVIHSVCTVVDNGAYSDLTFDAVVALGRIPPDSQHADTAAQTLANYLVKYRWPMYDSMRVKALLGLGNLRVTRIAAVLIEELLDDSPGIVSAASRSLEAVLGVRTATARILEAAVAADADTQAKLAAALRYMHRPSVVEELETTMLTGSEAQQTAARNLLSEVGGAQAFQRLKARTTAVTQYMGVLEEAETKIRKLFEDSIVEARHGFKIATSMDIVVFGIGVFLVLASAVSILWAGGTLDSWAGVGVTGGTGLLGVVYGLLIANPRLQVRDSVDHLMHLKVVFLAYLRQLHQTDQAYTRRLLDDRDFSATEVSSFTDMVGSSMTKALLELSLQPRPVAAPGPKTAQPSSSRERDGLTSR
jgi:hypothetical protein